MRETRRAMPRYSRRGQRRFDRFGEVGLFSFASFAPSGRLRHRRLHEGPGGAFHAHGEALSSSIVPTTHARATIAAKSRVDLEGNVGPQTQTACVGGPVWIGVGIWLVCRRGVGSLLAGLMTAHISRPSMASYKNARTRRAFLDWLRGQDLNL
ncbi:hypothetical protein [Mesorhizobium sp. WSM3873]|uniref:hypothetical protein n=1 Tax=Mesorhizobium sp. WSM3873 TaxID=1854056 RepID=UPI0012EAE11B|nr:hypothetical protein [Mesorhizobium sp. WSM3873]